MTSQPPRAPKDKDEEPLEYDGPSKSARKRAAHDAQDLGEELIRMRDSDLNSLNLPEQVSDAIRDARHITSRRGGARQRQYIGKLMRDVDLEPIYAFIASRSELDARETERFKRVEAWRERLIVEGTPALEELKRWRAGLDQDELTRLLSAAQSERMRTGANGAAGRELFRALRTLFEQGSKSADE